MTLKIEVKVTNKGQRSNCEKNKTVMNAGIYFATYLLFTFICVFNMFLDLLYLHSFPLKNVLFLPCERTSLLVYHWCICDLCCHGNTELYIWSAVVTLDIHQFSKDRFTIAFSLQQCNNIWYTRYKREIKQKNSLVAWKYYLNFIVMQRNCTLFGNSWKSSFSQRAIGAY